MKTMQTVLVSFMFLAWTFQVQCDQKKESLEAILRAEGIRSYDLPIQDQSKEWLIKEFGPGSVYPINLTLAIKNIVWQVREQIRKGEIPPIKGIIRTFWYTHIKPVFARTGSLNEKVEQSDVLHTVLTDLVRTQDIMRYKNMGFLDNNQAMRKIGRNWHVMIIGEKHGKYAVLEEISRDLDCTVFTLGGKPSILSAEYLVDEYKALGIDIRSSLYLIVVVDYDANGWLIRDAIIDDLKFYGMKNIQAIDIILPQILTKEELNLAKFPLPESESKLNEDWVERTGGIDGKIFGFESDSVPYERLKQKIIESGTPYVGDPEIIRRGKTVLDLSQNLNRLVQILLGLN